ncbi:hypothetical protein T12_11658, partial [Trichinella patagoniensis]
LRPKQDDGPSHGDGGNSRKTAAPTRIGKLPELTLPQFDGEALEFPTFWAQFEASVHANTGLDDATKFAYLLSNTTGRALGAIVGIPVTAANYPEAVCILQKRFGRPKIVAPPHFLALWKVPECREMTRQGIQTLVDEITKQLTCLAAMGKDPHAGELPLSEALMLELKEKFPRKLQRAWDLKRTRCPRCNGDAGNDTSCALLGSKRVARSRQAYDMPLWAAFPSACDRSVSLSTRASLAALLGDSWIPACPDSLFPSAASGLLQSGAVPLRPALRLRARFSPIDAFSRSAYGARGFTTSPPHSLRSLKAGVPRRRRPSSPSMLAVLVGSPPSCGDRGVRPESS